jgi:hypothetical protein
LASPSLHYGANLLTWGLEIESRERLQNEFDKWQDVLEHLERAANRMEYENISTYPGNTSCNNPESRAFMVCYSLHPPRQIQAQWRDWLEISANCW